MEKQAVYSMARNVHRLVTALSGADPLAVDGGLVLAYTRNHELACVVVANGFTVNWKPYLKPSFPLRMAGDTLSGTQGQALARFEADIDAPLGAHLVWLAPEVQEDLRQAIEKEQREASYA